MTDVDPGSEPLIPQGLVPRAILGFHALAALGLLTIAWFALQQGQFVQVGLMVAIAAMFLVAGIAAGRIAARR
jgi:hypothetical protein